MNGEARARIKVLSAGVLSLVLTLGIARFAYTPLLPIMQAQSPLGIAGGGWLAAINYMGYLLGAIIASQISDLKLKDRLYRIGLIVAVVTTTGMGLTEHFYLWSILRFFAGLSSAAGLLLGSGLILNWLIRHHMPSELGVHMAGGGLGIALGAVAVGLMAEHVSWDHQWIILSALGFALLIPAWGWLPPADTSGLSRKGEALVDNPPSAIFQKVFMAAYGCAGVGYVVSATFIVAIVEGLPGMAGMGAWSFLVLGLAAAPACILWDLLARKIDYLRSLKVAYAMQVVSIILPAFSSHPVLVFLSTAMFGASFIGIVSLVLTMAGKYYPTKPAKMMGKMTITYGCAQIVTPAITGVMTQGMGNYNVGLYIACSAMVLGFFLVSYLHKLGE